MRQNTKFKRTEIGMIPEDWEVLRMCDLVKINENTISKHYPDKIIEYIDTSSVDNGRLIGTQILNLKEAPSRAKRIVKDNDVLISTVRPNLKHFYFIHKSKRNLVASTGFAVISAKSINPKFLYYYLTTDTYTNYLSAIADAHTSTYPSFNPDIIEDSFCPVPNEDEQSAISKILSDLDSKIELNQRMNNALEAIGQALFKLWFIDFEFPNEKGEPYKSSGGKMVDSEMGEIPKGWGVGKLGEIAENFDSKRVPLSSRERDPIKGKFPYYGAASIMDYINKYIFDGVYLLMGEDGTVIDDNEHPILQYVWGRFWVNNHAHVLRGKGVFPTEYLFVLLKNMNIKHIVTGAVQPKINQANLNSIKIILPNNKILALFSNMISHLFNRYRVCQDEINHLISVRDSLLPKLMSGQIRVPVEARV